MPALETAEYFEGSTLLGSSVTPPYAATLTFTTTGNHAVFATATDSNGMTGNSAFVQLNITSQPPVVQITSPASGAAFQAPATISFTAQASDPDGGTVPLVQYFNTATGQIVASAGPPSYADNWFNVAAGTYTIYARAQDSSGTFGQSQSITITVADNLPPSVALTAPTANVTGSAPATVTFSATASDSDGIASVEFLLNGASIATVTTAPYTFTKTDIAAGTYTVSARATDTRGATSTTSGGPTITVTANAPPTVSITAPVNGAQFDAPATVGITASASDADGIAKVEFYLGTTLIATSTAAPYSTTLSNVTPGTYTFVAVATDTKGVSSTSTAVSIRVVVHTDPGETITFIHNDVAGSPLAATDTAGEIVWREAYRPFGDRIRREAAGATNRQWFTGKPEDSESGLVYFGARYLDPTLGRFMSRDPELVDERKLHTFNRYAYANNNPYRFIDPDGHEGRETLWMRDDAPLVVTARAFAALTAYGVALGTRDDALASTALDAMRESRQANMDTVIILAGATRGAKTPEARATSGPVFKTTREATIAAEKLGFRRINETSNGQAVYQRGKNEFITRDVDGHNGGAWKMAKSVESLASKETRDGTFDASLTTRIGQ